MKEEDNLQTAETQALNIPDVSGMLLPELEKELAKQQQIYTTEKDLIKANLANWYMTIILIEIEKRKQLSNYR